MYAHDVCHLISGPLISRSGRDPPWYEMYASMLPTPHQIVRSSKPARCLKKPKCTTTTCEKNYIRIKSFPLSSSRADSTYTIGNIAASPFDRNPTTKQWRRSTCLHQMANTAHHLQLPSSPTNPDGIYMPQRPATLSVDRSWSHRSVRPHCLETVPDVRLATCQTKPRHS